MPINIIDVLTAATPIVASVASIVAGNKKPDNKQEETFPVKQQPNINITITNHFYTNSTRDSIQASKIIEEQIKDSLLEPGIRYIP